MLLQIPTTVRPSRRHPRPAPPAEKLTARQADILRFIRESLEANATAPTVQEIQGEFGFRSPNAVQSHFKALQKKGYIERSPNRARSIRLVGPGDPAESEWRRPLSGYRPKRLARRESILDRAAAAPKIAVSPPDAAPAPTPPQAPPEIAVTPPVTIPAPPAAVVPGPVVPVQVLDESLTEPARPAGVGYEIGVDVFFNARHVTAGEFDGELHAHSWRIQATVLMDSGGSSGGDSTGGGRDEEQVALVRDALLCVTSTFEATVLNDLDHFQSGEPSLQPMAIYLASLIDAELTRAGAHLLSTTLWDQPTQYITVRQG